ncbi:hypothetical protein RhiirA5_351973 [Rhizophagus irregularis]|uniref:Uncharacterized protein n=1 Tax=Rhizophagus irregularis TaxID=588596 RepID=A0A2N0Q242_9GLOM|nr:hypothetical protein RhiirA5_351973 [Rhizophagus irregularis]CAB5190238.1 unnamed protein product [Rhizophagus irregularis]
MKLQVIFSTLLFVILMLLNLICLGFFIAKYLSLKRINFEIPINNVDYVYLGLISVTALKDVTLIIAAFRGSLNLLNPRQQIISQILLLIAWIVVPALYTKFELDRQLLSSMCPQQYMMVCLLRKISFILMWAYSSMLFISILSAVCFKSVDEEDEENDDNYNEGYNINIDKEKFKPQPKTNQFHPRYSKNNNYNRYNNVSSIHSNNSSIPPYNNLSHLR